ncbi:spermidine/putrescine ABC transporter substrate-binding protein [Labrys sp. (in: a-proteobacteria)]|uniref:polyamine ABC transporter substrate-binding protein n=1 Tax=Labrys sp. (in: a-proteobacteria) TaxID=1917972 RepID=UPI0039E6E3AC
MTPPASRAPARRLLLATILAGVAGLSATATARAADELNALVWCDHTDPALIEPFEKANNVKVNLKTYEGTGAGLSIIAQSRPGDWDVLVIDAIDVKRAVDQNLLAEMPAEALPLADTFPEVRMEAQNAKDGKIYAATEKFGYNTISYDKTKVDPKDMQDLSVMWSDKYKGRIAIYDYYLPVMGLVQVGLGKKTAELSEADLPAIQDKLAAMKKVSKQVSEVTASQTALATGEVDILVGGGEWITAALAAEKPNLDWTVPDQGAVRWAQSIGVMKDAAHKDLALKFVQYILSPEGQARLATSSCYWAMPANKKAGEHLTDAQKAALRWNDQAGYLAKAQLYPAPNAELDKKMQDAWTDMMQQ